MIFFICKIIPNANRTYPLATASGLAATVLIGLVLLAAAALTDHRYDSSKTADHIETLGDYMAIIIVVFLPALGGAMRFMSEKLAIEAEALSYRDAHVWFEHAKDILSELAPGRGDAKADAQRKRYRQAARHSGDERERVLA